MPTTACFAQRWRQRASGPSLASPPLSKGQCICTIACNLQIEPSAFNFQLSVRRLSPQSASQFINVIRETQMKSIFFSTIEVTRQVFYRSPLSYAVVNLKPIVPGHVLVLPRRVVTRLRDLDASELSDLMASVQRVGTVIERVYGADALTIACQDGKAAGQTMPHVHFHLMPRKLRGDRFEENMDEIYPEIERNGKDMPRELQAAIAVSAEKARVDHGAEPLKVDADEDRKPRSMAEMVEEAEWLKGFFPEQEGQD